MHTHNPYSKCKVNRKVFKEKGGGTPGSFDRVEPFYPNAVVNLICSVPHSVKRAGFRSVLEGLNISSHSEQVKPGFTNYQPRGLAKRISLIWKKNESFENHQKNTKKL